MTRHPDTAADRVCDLLEAIIPALVAVLLAVAICASVRGCRNEPQPSAAQTFTNQGVTP